MPSRRLRVHMPVKRPAGGSCYHPQHSCDRLSTAIGSLTNEASSPPSGGKVHETEKIAAYLGGLPRGSGAFRKILSFSILCSGDPLNVTFRAARLAYSQSGMSANTETACDTVAWQCAGADICQGIGPDLSANVLICPVSSLMGERCSPSPQVRRRSANRAADSGGKDRRADFLR